MDSENKQNENSELSRAKSRLKENLLKYRRKLNNESN